MARVLGLDERVTQELVSLQPRRAAQGIHSNPDPGCAWGLFEILSGSACTGSCCCGPGALSWVPLARLPWAARCCARLGNALNVPSRLDSTAV